MKVRAAGRGRFKSTTKRSSTVPSRGGQGRRDRRCDSTCKRPPTRRRAYLLSKGDAGAKQAEKVASNSRATSRGAMGQTAALQGRSVMSELARNQELIARVEG